MSTRQMRKRLAAVQAKVCPTCDDGCTFEELCRTMWRRDPERCREMADEGNVGMRSLILQFEREDAERSGRLPR